MIFAFLANRPAVFTVVALSPPAIQDTAIRLSIQRCFLAAGTTGLVRANRIVQPEICTGNQVASHIYVVVFQEDNFSPECIAAREAVNLLDQRFAWPVSRMGFACKDDLRRTFRIVQDTSQAFGIAEDERGSLICSKAPRKTNDQGIRTEHVLELGHLDRSLAQAQVMAYQIAACIADQGLFPLRVNLPQFLVRNLCERIPQVGFIHMLFPIFTQVAFEEGVQLWRDPG